MIWRTFMDCLPTRARLGRLFYVVDWYCLPCGGEEGDAVHLFKECLIARSIWFSSRWALKVDNIQSADIRDFISWLLSKSEEPGFEDFLLFVGCTLDCIWRWRIELLFSGGRCDVSTMISQIHEVFAESSQCFQQEFDRGW